MLVAVVFACISGWLTILCLSLYCHRAIAHRAVSLHPAVAHFMRFWLWLTTGASTRAWVAVHRKHHAFVDRDGDPHSPVVYGLPNILFLGYFYYRRETQDPETLAKYGRDCPDDWLERNVYVRLHFLGLALLATFDMLAFGPWGGLAALGIQIAWEALWAAGVINGLGHALGYRSYESRDSSRNIVPVGLLISGEELHNNHHRWPRSAKFSARWFEVDLGWGVLRGLAALGLAKDLYVFDRRLEEHRSERAFERAQRVCAEWRTRLQVLAEDSRKTLTQKRARFERLRRRYVRKLERTMRQLDLDARARLAEMKATLLAELPGAFPLLARV